MFILRQKLFLALIALGVLGWAALLIALTIRNGKSVDVGLVAFVSIVSGAGTALLVMLPGFFLYRSFFTKPPTAELEPGEQVLSTLRANHFLDGEGRGGQLLVTERRLRFVPHRYNVQLALWSVPWEEVRGFTTPDSAVVTAVAVATGVPSRPLQNFLVVELRDGRRERLVVFNRKQTAEHLERLRQLGRDERLKAAPTAA
jgi:hypothetical protein